jgi:hypothetical protein
MGDIVDRLSERHACGTDVRSGAGSVGVRLDFVPEAVEVSSSCVVSPDCVEGVGDPVARNGGVALQHCQGSDRADHQIILDDVASFDAVLDEDVVAFDQETDVLLDKQVVGSVNGQHSGVRVVDCYSSDEAVGHLPGHVEMRAVPSDNLRLSTLGDLSVGKSGVQAICGLPHEHQVRTVVLGLGHVVSLDYDIPRQQSDLGPHHEVLSAISLNS